MQAIVVFDPRKRAFVNQEFKIRLDAGRLGLPVNSSITLTSYHPDTLKYEYTAPNDAFAVFSEVFYDKGWKAYIDGKETSIIRADYILRALQVPGGNHKIEFIFAPESVKTTNLLSGIASVILVLGWQVRSGNKTGDAEKILNIQIDPAKNKGYTTTLRLGYGTEDRYQATGMILAMKEGMQISALGNLNNINAPLFDFNTQGGGARRRQGGGGARGGGGMFGGANGITNTGSFGLNYRQDYNDKELGNILGNDRKIENTKKSVYETLEEDSLHAKNTAFAFIGDYTDIMGATAIEKLLQFAKEGGEVFISTNYYSSNLLDTLNLSSAYLDVNNFSGFSLLGDINYSLVNSRKRIKYDKIEQTSIFDLIDSTNISIAGNAYAGKHAVPNFVEVSWGKGKLYLHHTPEMFTNYYMLQHQKYDYAASALKLIKAKNIIWCDNYYREGQPSTPLRMILSYEGLREAWYVLLFGLLLFLLFRSKREQRAVEVVTPEPNLSKEFAKTIGTLYYENGEPGNMIGQENRLFPFISKSFSPIRAVEDGKP
ncbi:hypothetical protein FQR65_LT17972 [Abscondita terminalis]|nr:hypothetical protein FQR65_LT17972 [Abscondita terminalis]